MARPSLREASQILPRTSFLPLTSSSGSPQLQGQWFWHTRAIQHPAAQLWRRLFGCSPWQSHDSLVRHQQRFAVLATRATWLSCLLLASALPMLWLLLVLLSRPEASGSPKTDSKSSCQNQAGAIWLRAKGTVAPLDLSRVNQVPRALNWKLVAAWVPPIMAGGQAPGHSGPPQGLLIPTQCLAPDCHGRRSLTLHPGRVTTPHYLQTLPKRLLQGMELGNVSRPPPNENWATAGSLLS